MLPRFTYIKSLERGKNYEWEGKHYTGKCLLSASSMCFYWLLFSSRRYPLLRLLVPMWLFQPWRVGSMRTFVEQVYGGKLSFYEMFDADEKLLCTSEECKKR